MPSEFYSTHLGMDGLGGIAWHVYGRTSVHVFDLYVPAVVVVVMYV